MSTNDSQDVAASCIFLATKTEECGRKLLQVAKVFCSKVYQTKFEDVVDNSRVWIVLILRGLSN